MQNTKVKELMTKNPIIISPDATLRYAAETMKDIDCGFLPIGSKDKLKGIITDRDIITRGIATGADPELDTVQDYMTFDAFGCNEEDFLEDAADKMRQHKVGRLIVKNDRGDVTGILSFGGILRKNADAQEVANVVKRATRKAVA